jgi:hypothetical protein
MERGDKVCILLGCQIPLILRRVGEHYIYIGEAYVDGYMYGKGVEEMDKGRFKVKDFDIR